MTVLPSHSAYFRDRRFERDVTRLHALGPRVLAELLRQIGAETLHMTMIEQIAARFAELDPDTVRPLGGDHFPTRPALRLVGGRRHG